MAEAVSSRPATHRHRHEAADAAGGRRRRDRGGCRRDVVVRRSYLQPPVLPTWRGEDAAQITQALEGAGIPYKLEDGGRRSACRPNNSPPRACSLASQGLPEGGGGVNAVTKDPGFGVSAFMESARYQHALETELARTIAALQNVQARACTSRWRASPRS